MNEIKKKLLFQGLQYGQSLYFEQSGFLHYCYETIEKPICIPLYENFLFALLLLEKKEKDSFLRGQNILKRLFAFQKRGGFCLYIHGFPNIDEGMSFRLLPIFSALENRFFSLFDSKFQKTFLKAKSGLERYLEGVFQKRISFLQELTFRCYWNKNVDDLFLDETIWQMSPTKMKSQMLIALSMLEDIPAQVIENLFAFYDEKLEKTIHPYFNELSLEGDLCPSLFSEVQKIYFGKKGIESFHALLQIPLVKDSFFEGKKSSKIITEGNFPDRWQIARLENGIAVNIEKTREIHPRKLKRFHPFCFHFSGGSLVLQEVGAKVKMDLQEDRISLQIEMDKEIEPGETFCHFYIKNETGMRCKIGDKTTSVFYPGENLSIVRDDLNIEMTMNSTCKVVGHVGFGKRPSEITQGHIDRMIYFRSLEKIKKGIFTIQLECAAKEELSSAKAMACMPLST